jgi:hypothetical protein
VTEQSEATAPIGPSGHTIAIAGGWSLWRQICVRSAGFPIAMLEPLGSPAAARAAEALGDATLDIEARRAAAVTCAAELARITRCVRELAAHARFREAMTWQNRNAVQTGLDPLLRLPDDASNSKARQKELMVASYLQRYCAKNDTIGFFGPLGWGELTERGPALHLRVGEALLARRMTCFEHWTIDELARNVAADPALLPFLTPRRHPTVRVEGTSLWDARLRKHEIGPAFARLLIACDGSRPARSLAAELVADRTLELEGEQEVYALLTQLVELNLAFWSIETPTVGPHPGRSLDATLASLDGPARERALSAFDQLERGRRHVESCAGDPDSLDRALEQLADTFSGMTGSAATRRAGAVYAGRTLVYEECKRDFDCHLGPLFLERLGPPLSLLLKSARWFTWSISQAYASALLLAHRALQAETGADEIEYLRLWERVASLFPNTASAGPLVADVQTELQRRWTALLHLEPGERHARRTVEHLRARVEDAFDARQPGWPWARHHCPDVLIAATGPEAVARGDFYLVLGELHCAGQNYLMPTWLALHADGESLLRAREADIRTPCVFPVTSRHQATRVDQASMSSRDIDLEIGDTRSYRDRDQVVAVADLVCEEVGGRLSVRTRDRRYVFDGAAFFGYYLTAECMSQFKLLPDAPHTPRVTIDDLVITRESWTFAAADLGFCHLKGDRLERFVACRHWAIRHGLPRFVFMKIPEEAKPTYLDLESPLYVELMARMVRKSSKVSLSEMLPGPHESWLEDADGNRYASELRITAVDPTEWRRD